MLSPSRTYHPFGSTSYELHTNDSEVSLKRYQYVGKERDGESGLYYYGARYYADWLCRFVSVDPLKDDYPYYTTYQYAGNKPITSIDVDGLEAENQVEEEEVGQQGGSESNSSKHDVFINAHGKSMEREFDKLIEAEIEFGIAKKEFESLNKYDENYKTAKKRFRKAKRELHGGFLKEGQFKKFLGEKSDFDFVEFQIQLIIEMDRLLTYDEVTLKDLNFQEWDDNSKIRSGDPINMIQTLSRIGVSITIERTTSTYKGMTQNIFVRNSIIEPTDENTSKDIRNRFIQLHTSIPEINSSVFNEVADIFFTFRFHKLKEVDNELIKLTQNKYGVSRQDAYDMVYYELYQEMFSGNIQNLVKPLLKNYKP